jgi:hypothetical protein
MQKNTFGDACVCEGGVGGWGGGVHDNRQLHPKFSKINKQKLCEIEKYHASECPKNIKKQNV